MTTQADLIQTTLDDVYNDGATKLLSEFEDKSKTILQDKTAFMQTLLMIIKEAYSSSAPLMTRIPGPDEYYFIVQLIDDKLKMGVVDQTAANYHRGQTT